MLRRGITLLIAATGLVAMTGCTPGQIQKWIAWHDADPEAAVEFAQQDWVQDSLRQFRLTPNISDNNDGGDVDLDGEGTPGDCESYRDEIAAAGLPVNTFINIGRRETHCDPYAWVVDGNDTGGAFFGFNFKGNLAGYLRDLCGATVNNIRGNIPLIMSCAKALYDSRGLDPWQ
jgi:hypothetical protein